MSDSIPHTPAAGHSSTPDDDDDAPDRFIKLWQCSNLSCASVNRGVYFRRYHEEGDPPSLKCPRCLIALALHEILLEPDGTACEVVDDARHDVIAARREALTAKAAFPYALVFVAGMVGSAATQLIQFLVHR